MKRERMIMAVLAGGYFLTMIEVRHLHRYVISEEWWGWIPIVYCFCAIVASFLGMVSSVRVKWLAISIFLAGLVVGPMGIWRHSDGKPLRKAERMIQQVREANTPEDKPRPDGAPLLAPLGISGLSLLGAIVLWPVRRTKS